MNIPATVQPKAAILWEGASLLDGAPIVLIATTSSKNTKTGRMVQTWILRADTLATDAIHSGHDESICGECPKRGEIVGGRNVGRTCYVKVFQAPRSVSAKYLRGGYDIADPREFGRGRMVRVGSYGDPAAVPSEVWRHLVSEARGWTGYTHQWRWSDLRDICMASVDNLREREIAQAYGWRTFRVARKGSTTIARRGEIVCPASKEAGAKTTCAKCSLCRGASDAIPSIAIMEH